MERRLAAILAADIADYSLLMGADEVGTLSALRQLRSQTFAPVVEKHRGSVIKSMGDGWLVEFDSVVEAVTGAVEVQQALADHPTIKLRVGIHIGDIIHADEDIFGDGVNVAARLQEVCTPGGIVISAFAHAAVKGAIDELFYDAGERQLKNIVDGVGTYYWGMAPEMDNKNGGASLGLTKPSIAIMPFEASSKGETEALFSDGMTHDLIAALNRIDWLKVVHRGSVFAYKGLSLSTKQIADELGVRYILEGRLRTAGDRVRITTQLFRAETGEQIWAEDFDRDVADIFAVQEEICDKILASIDSSLRHAERDWARQKPPGSLDAWENYHRGLEILYHRIHGDSSAALPYLEKALELSPDFAAPHAGIADSLYHKVIMQETESDEDAEEALNLAYEHGSLCLQMDDRSAYGYSVLGRVHCMRGEFELAQKTFDQALSLNRYFALTHMGLASMYIWTGHVEASLGILDTAITLSPRDNLRWGFCAWKAVAYFNLRRYAECEEMARILITSKPEVGYGHGNLANALHHQGRNVEAAEAFQESLRLMPGSSIATLRRALPRFDNEYLDNYFETGRALGLPEN